MRRYLQDVSKRMNEKLQGVFRNKKCVNKDVGTKRYNGNVGTIRYKGYVGTRSM